MSFFPSQLIVLLDDDENPVNLLFMTELTSWVREDGEWVLFEVDEENPKRQFEGMQMTSVDPGFIDVWDDGDASPETLAQFEYVFKPNASRPSE